MAAVKKGDRLKHDGGFMGTAGEDAAEGEALAVRQDDGAVRKGKGVEEGKRGRES